MTVRFICPHCHASLNPHAMERAFSELAEYRICPACDEAVFFALRDAPSIPTWLQRTSSSREAERTCASPLAPAAGAHPECR